MRRTVIYGLGFVAMGLLSASWTWARGPATDSPSADGIHEARLLVKQLEAQRDLQKASLLQTEANLEQARTLLNVLEKDSNAADVPSLQAEADRIQDQITKASRFARNPDTDPVVIRYRKMLDKINNQISERQAKD